MWFDATLSFELGKNMPLLSQSLENNYTQNIFKSMIYKFWGSWVFAAVYFLFAATRPYLVVDSKDNKVDGNLLTLGILRNSQEESQVLHENICPQG